MLAFASVWMGLACLTLSMVMLLYRPYFTDLNIWLILWLGSPGTLCFAGMILWVYRGDDAEEPGVVAQRIQCKVAIAEALVAAAIVYSLIFNAQTLPDGLPTPLATPTITTQTQ